LLSCRDTYIIPAKENDETAKQPTGIIIVIINVASVISCATAGNCSVRYCLVKSRYAVLERAAQGNTTLRFIELSFDVPFDTRRIISETLFPANLLAVAGKTTLHNN